LRVAHTGFLLLVIYPLESVRRYWNTEGERYDMWSNIALLAIEATLFVGMILAATGNSRMVNAARRAVLLLTLLIPALLLDFTQARLTGTEKAAFAPRAPLPMIQQKTSLRVLWLLFDEFDERLAFEVRRPAVALPELDRLRNQGFTATQANQTGSWTMMALPSLLDGRMYSRVELVNYNTLRLIPEGGGKPVAWRDEPNVFQKAREAGVNSALIGWHHPYCRVLGDEVAKCVEETNGHPTAALLREISVADEGVLKATLYLLRLQLANVLDILNVPETSAVTRDEFVQHRQQRQYFAIRKPAFEAMGDPNYGFVFVHFPIPHLYAIYNRKRADFSLDRTLDYADNFALVDRTLGEIRRLLDEKGLSNSTTILLSSDHGVRPDVWKGRLGWTAEMEELTASGQSPRVPFIVKFAGTDQGVMYEKPFSAVVTSGLVLSILRGEVNNPTEAAQWVDSQQAHTVASNH
jgi:hypothetical protein